MIAAFAPMLASAAPALLPLGSSAAAGAGGAGLSSMLLPAAMGFMGSQSLSGGSGITGISLMPRLTPKELELKKTLYKTIDEFMPSKNLALTYIGKAKKMVQARRKLAGSMVGPSRQGLRTGATGLGLINEMSNMLTLGTEGARSVADLRRQTKYNRLKAMEQYVGLERPNVYRGAQESILKSQLKQSEGAQRGQALGGMLQLLALAKYPYK